MTTTDIHFDVENEKRWESSRPKEKRVTHVWHKRWRKLLLIQRIPINRLEPRVVLDLIESFIRLATQSFRRVTLQELKGKRVGQHIKHEVESVRRNRELDAI